MPNPFMGLAVAAVDVRVGPANGGLAATVSFGF